MAFFPCIYFCATSQILFYWDCKNYRRLTTRQKTDAILERAEQRERFFSLAVKMLATAKERGLRLIMENPWNEQTYLKANFVCKPSLVDIDRTRRGDYYKKPTAYWYINSEPTYGASLQKDKETKTIMNSKPAAQSGLCSEERSMISPDYARNFICDFIIGKEQPHTLPKLFEI